MQDYNTKRKLKALKKEVPNHLHKMIVEELGLDWNKVSMSNTQVEVVGGVVFKTTLYYYEKTHIASWSKGNLTIYNKALN